MNLQEFKKRNLLDKTHNIIIDCVIELSNGGKRHINIFVTEDYIYKHGEEKIKNELLSLSENELSKNIVYEKFYADSQDGMNKLKEWRET
jgi:hypothetical protein